MKGETLVSKYNIKGRPWEAMSSSVEMKVFRLLSIFIRA